MKLSTFAEAIYKDMENQYSRCLIRVGKKELFKAGLDAFILGAYKDAIDKAYDSGCITKDEGLHLFEVLKCFVNGISKLIEMEVND